MKPAVHSIVIGTCAIAALLAIFPASAAQKASNQKPTTYDLRTALGKDQDAYAKAFKTKFKEEVEEVPDTVAGRRYTHAELESLPMRKNYSWTAEIEKFGTVHLGRNSNDKYVKYVSIVFEASAVNTGAIALSKVGIPSKGVKLEPDEDGGFGFEIKQNNKTWTGWFIPKHPDLDDKPNLQLWPED